MHVAGKNSHRTSSSVPTSLGRLAVFAGFNPALIIAFAAVLILVSGKPRIPLPEFDLDRPVRIVGSIGVPPEYLEDSLHLLVHPERVVQDERPFQLGSPVHLYIRSASLSPRDFFQPPLRFGELVEFKSRLNLPTYYAVPGVLDNRDTAWAKGTYFRSQLKSPSLLLRKGLSNSFRTLLLRPVFSYLRAFEDSARHQLPPAVFRLLMSSLLGRQAALHQAERRQIEEMQLQHLFVVSGLHVALVLGFAHLLIRRRNLGSLALKLLITWTYVAAVGFPVPSVRAGILVTLLYVGHQLALRTRLLNNLGLSALAILLVTPESARLPGFHFSYVCLLAIAASVAPASRRIAAMRSGISEAYSERINTRITEEALAYRRCRFAFEEFANFLPRHLLSRFAGFLCAPLSYLLTLLVCTLAIPVALFPIVIYYSNQWNPAQPINNLVIVPAFSLFVPAGLSFLALHWTPISSIAAWLTSFTGSLCRLLIDYLSPLSEPHFVPHPSTTEIWLYYILLAVLILRLPCRRQWMLCLFPATLLFQLSIPTEPAPFPLTITVLDVGQGESIHLRFPDQSNALIDTGPAMPGRESYVARRVIARYLWEQRIRRLDYLMITHPEVDHMGGFPFIWKQFRPVQLIHFRNSPSFEEPALPLSAGATFQYGGAFHTVLHPTLNEGSRWGSNDSSLVLRLDFGRFSALLPGDIGRKVEMALGEKLEPATLLKIAHHGSRTSSTRSFLQKVHPRLAIVSAGRGNHFGHPAAEVLQRFEDLKIPVLSTIDSGSIRLETDGEILAISTYSMKTHRFEKWGVIDLFER